MHYEGPLVITAMPSSHNATLNKLDRDGRVIGQGLNVHLARCEKAAVPPRLRNFDPAPALGADPDELIPVPRYNLRSRTARNN